MTKEGGLTTSTTVEVPENIKFLKLAAVDNHIEAGQVARKMGLPGEPVPDGWTLSVNRITGSSRRTNSTSF